MLANTLLYLLAFSFIVGFFAILAFGHVLLARAIWPNLFKRIETQPDTVAGTARQAHQH
jgi:hypothetical protein